MQMNEYISREAIKQVLCGIANGLSVGETEALKTKDVKALYKIKGAKEILNVIDNNLSFIPVADVQPVDRWISVKDRLPEENILVLCYARSTTGEGNNYFLGALAHGEFWFLKVNDIGHVSCPVLHWKVTHWQPLPESPKED